MSDPETFLIQVYVLVDEYLALVLPDPPVRSGPPPALAPSEVVTLAIMRQWNRFGSERDFYRYADAQLRSLFPTLPSRPQFNRQVRRWHALIASIGAELGHALAPTPTFEVIDTTAVPVRNVKRRGSSWLENEITIGKSSRLGWFEGFHLLTCSNETGVLTGIGIGAATENDRPLAETLFSVRQTPEPRLPAVGYASGNLYLADKGFGGQEVEQRYRDRHGATVICPPQDGRKTRVWTKELSHWLTHHRQIIETVHARLIQWFRLAAIRPHTLDGALGMLASIFALHNITIWLNRQAGRPDLAIVDVLGW